MRAYHNEEAKVGDVEGGFEHILEKNWENLEEIFEKLGF